MRVLSASLLVPSDDFTVAYYQDFACDLNEVMLDSHVHIPDVGTLHIMAGGYWTGNQVIDARTTRVHYTRYDGTDYTIYFTARCLTGG